MNILKANDKPREKYLKKGPVSLSDIELLAIIISSGVKGSDVKKISKKVLKLFDDPDRVFSIKELCKIKGMGNAKAMKIGAAHEFFRRRFNPSKNKITMPSDILPMLNHYADRKQEHFLCVSLNGANEVLKKRVISIGLVNRTIIHPREIFAEAIEDRASAIILCHNHPSGNIEPSPEDLNITKRLTKASEILGIPILDHIIFSSKGYYSFLENDVL